MKKESMEIIEKMILKLKRTRSDILFAKKENTSKVIQMYPEAWHMYHVLVNEHNLVPPLEIQGTIEIYEEQQMIRLLWFIHPIMVNERNMNSCISFANEVNRELGRGGHFWVDSEYYDFAYEQMFDEKVVELFGEDLLEKYMFEMPLNQYRDIHIPLMMLLSEQWEADKAIRFLKELREDGFVENSRYELFPAE